MGKSEEWKSGLRMAGLASLSAGALLTGILVREQRSLSSRIPTFQTLVASKDIQSIPEDDYFTELANILRDDYVDPISDEMKLATGAIKGMIASLNDTNSVFYDREEMTVVLRGIQGQYEGIGAEFGFEFGPSKGTRASEGIPNVVVRSVIPGSSAEKAGLRVGAKIETIDDHWVMNSEFIQKARDIQEKVLAKKLPATAMDNLRKEIRTKSDGAITPIRAWKRLAMGQAGTTKIEFVFAGQSKTAQIPKGIWKRRIEPKHEEISLVPGAEKSFSPSPGNIQFDLRGQGLGDYPTMLSLIKKLGIVGSLGVLKREGKRSPVPIVIKGASSPASRITVYVNGGTSGVPEIFAQILAKAGAKIEGKSAGNPVATQITILPDNSGYTLNLGKFEGGSTK
jgi:carboxyl-terminal processing protease